MNVRAPLVAFACGGTGGHVFPALAVADVYRKRTGRTALFVGTHTGGFENRLVPARGYRLVLISGAPLFGRQPFQRPRAFTRLIAGVREARALFRREGVGMVLGFGGYASAGALLAAWTMRIPRAIVECNVTPGLVNELLRPIANRIYLGFEEGRRHFSWQRSRMTGVPIRREISGAALRATPPVPGGPWILLVLGGSQGSEFLNRRAPEVAATLRRYGEDVRVLHQSGGGAEEVGAAYASGGITAEVVPFIEDMVTAYQGATLAISSAGAGTLEELAVVGLPSLIVPLGVAARDHQSFNAVAYAASVECAWMREDDWNSEAVAAHLARMARDPEAWGCSARRLLARARPDAATRIVDEILDGCFH